MQSIDYDRTYNVFVHVNIGAKNHNFNIPLILDKYKTMIVKKIKFIQECTFAINVECLHSSLRTKQRMQNCAHANTFFVAYKGFCKLSHVENQCVRYIYTRAINTDL